MFLIREANEQDKNFIYSTWLKGLYFGNDFYKEIVKDVYFQQYSRVIEAILARPGTHVAVICLQEDPATILGYAVYTLPAALHWVFIKAAWRRQGLAKKLVPEGIKSVTHITKPGLAIARQKGLDFNPFLL